MSKNKQPNVNWSCEYVATTQLRRAQRVSCWFRLFEESKPLAEEI